MKVELNIPSYAPEKGVITEWEPGHIIKASIDKDQVLIQADRAGLISLARHFLTLAQENVPKGCHIHYDSYNSLEDGSCEVIIDKISSIEA